MLLRTDAIGAYDGNAVLLVERVADGRPRRGLPPGLPRRRMWQVRARQVVLATGASERPIVFPGNDRPGVMLAGAARAYATRWAVVPERAVVFTSTDAGHGAALELAAAGVEVPAVVDARVDVDDEIRAAAGALGIEVLVGQGVSATHGDGGLEAVDVAPLGHYEGSPRRLECDLLAVSGGFDPVLDLHLHRGRPSRFDEELACLVPDDPAPGMRLAGACRGSLGLDACIREGAFAGASAARDAGFEAVEPDWPIAGGADGDGVEACWLVPAAEDAWETAFVDLNRDVTVRDLGRAVGAGLRSVEHVKRYTLTGTGADQGRTARVNAAAITASLTGLPVADLATSSSRPPFQPVPFAALAAGARGPALRRRAHDPAARVARRPRGRLRGRRPVEAPALLRAARPGHGLGARPRVPRRPRARGADGRLDARQDRRRGPRRAGAPGAPVHDRPRLAGRRPRPLRADVHGGRHGVRRRRRHPPRGAALPDHDHHRQRRDGAGVDGGVAADGVAGAARVAHVGHRAVGDGRRRRPAQPRAAGRGGARPRPRARGLPLHDGARRARGGHRRAGRPRLVLRRARLRGVGARRSRPRAVGGPLGGRRAVRRRRVRHRDDARAARGEGLRDRRPGDGRDGDAARPRAGLAGLEHQGVRRPPLAAPSRRHARAAASSSWACCRAIRRACWRRARS